MNQFRQPMQPGGRYDNLTPPRFLAPTDCLKIPTLFSPVRDNFSETLCAAAQLPLREKSVDQRVGTDSIIPSLPGGSMKFKWWKLKMSYHTVYPSWDCPAIVCYLFLYSFICAPTATFTWLSKFCKGQLSSIFYLSQGPSLRRVSFLKGCLNFKSCLRRQLVKPEVGNLVALSL